LKSIQVNAKPIQLQTLNNECYLRIKEMILCGTYPWGTRIEVGTLADTFGISKFPVIKAIERLGLEKLVVISPNRGTYVTVPTIKDIREVSDIRILLETYACQTAYNHDADLLIERLKMNENAHTWDILSHDPIPFRDFLDYDRVFHLSFVELTNNERFITYYLNIRSQAELFRTKTFSCENIDGALHMHHKIIENLEAKKISMAIDSLVTHLKEVEKETLDSL